MTAFANHIKDKDHLLRRSEELIEQHSSQGNTPIRSSSKDKAQLERKMALYQQNLKYWIEQSGS